MRPSDNYIEPRVQHALGDTFAFVPSAFSAPPKTGGSARKSIETAYSLRGVVVYVNTAHRYYTVEAPCWGYVIRECFKY